MNELTLNYGGQPVTFQKSLTTYAVKTKNGEELPKSRNVDAPKTEKMGAFTLVEVSPEPASRGVSNDVEAALDEARQTPNVSVGTHVFYVNEAKSPLIPTGVVHVIFSTDSDKASNLVLLESHHLNIIETIADNEFITQLTPASANPLKVALALQNEAEVAVAEPDFLKELVEHAFVPPTSKLFKEQWHLENEGPDRYYWANGGVGIFSQTYFKKGADAKVVEAWAYLDKIGKPALGDKNIVIAVIDGAFDLQHPNLKGDGTKIRNPYDFNNNDADPTARFLGETHGTSCAGVAVGALNSFGALGACPNARLMPIQWSRVVSDLDAKKWFEYAMNNGADIISCSWGWPAGFNISTLMQNTLREVSTNGRNGKGCIVCFAAGNANPHTSWRAVEVSNFAADPNVICVAASTSLDTPANYSFYGKNVSIAAPSSGGDGFATITTASVAPDLNENPSQVFTLPEGHHYTSWFGGTSSSCPLIAGICGLLLTANNNLTAKDVKNILQLTTDKVTDLNLDLEGYVNGHSKKMGHGRVNALKAVSIAGIPPPPPPPILEATVNAQKLNVRSGPSTAYAKVDTLSEGNKVLIYRWHDRWAEIGTERFVHANYLTILNNEQGIINANRLNVRTGPSMDYDVSRQLDRGNRVKVLEKVGDWLKITDTEYVHGHYVTTV
ncbi:MAG: S8 family serine peptidase [Chitinophagales bacterium]